MCLMFKMIRAALTADGDDLRKTLFPFFFLNNHHLPTAMYPHSDFLALATRFVLYVRITGYFVRPARPRLLITAPPPAPPPTLVFGPWDGVPFHVSTLGLFSLPTP
jgi:hypothetical protein